jgi:hypothetical protein
MSANVVTVTEAFGAGMFSDWLFVAGGTLVDDSGNAIVTPVVRGRTMAGGTGILTAALLASDNYSAGQLLWTCFVRVQGLPLIEVHDFAVNFGNGANQVLFTVLKAAGWTPTTI